MRSAYDLKSFVPEVQEIVYNYLSDTCGVIPIESNQDFVIKYSNYSIKNLKFALRSLKQVRSADASELRYVSGLIRSKLAKKGQNELRESADLERDLNKNFWSKCRKIFDTATKSLPTFDLLTCYNYFVQMLKLKKTDHSFQPPSWIPPLNPPPSSSAITPPTYQAVARAINRCKSSFSACPLDQLSIIILKNCPILRTLLHRIITQCWSDRVVPDIWKRGVTILIYKKGDTADPANFRPIYSRHGTKSWRQCTQPQFTTSYKKISTSTKTCKRGFGKR